MATHAGGRGSGRGGRMGISEQGKSRLTGLSARGKNGRAFCHGKIGPSTFVRVREETQVLRRNRCKEEFCLGRFG